MDYITITDCIATGQHLTDCDDDGYCNACGAQENIRTDIDLAAEELRFRTHYSWDADQNTAWMESFSLKTSHEDFDFMAGPISGDAIAVIKNYRRLYEDGHKLSNINTDSGV